jgi:hypothetical protein
LPGYRKLLREAGYGAVRSYHAWDGYNKPTVLLPLDNRKALRFFASSERFAGRGLRAAVNRLALSAAAVTGLWAQFASEYIFLVARD